MTAEPDLLPSSVAAFTEALHGERGSLDAWLEVNDEREVRAHIEAYASARVARATAELKAEMQALAATADAGFRDGWNRAAAARDAEVEALRVEVERLRAIAGCAYQMAGVHDAPEVWLDRLGQAANGDALPDPDTISDELLPYQPDAVCEAEARAERLAEALRDAEKSLRTIADRAGGTEYLMTIGDVRGYANSRANAARAALEQENDDA